MFLYFIPIADKPSQTAATEYVIPDLTPYGLGVSLADVKTAPADATAYALRISLDESEPVEGVLLTPHVNGSAPNQITYKPDRQTWLKIPVGDNWVGVGWPNDNAPTPSALTRTKRYGGIECDDASGEKWLIPIARGGGRNGVTLPADYEFDPITFEATEKPNADFDALWAIAGELWDHWNTDQLTLEKTEIARYALSALAVNYRVGPIELSAFRAMGKKVIDETSAAVFGLALIDWQMADEIKKKLTQVDES